METLSAPYLLIATPTLLDPNFVQSVVLMGHHDSEGAMGWIVNRLHERPVRELLAPGQQQGVHAETPLHLGGPVPADAVPAVFPKAIHGPGGAGPHPGAAPRRLRPQALRVSSTRDVRTWSNVSFDQEAPQWHAATPASRSASAVRAPSRSSRRASPPQTRRSPSWPAAS